MNQMDGRWAAGIKMSENTWEPMHRKQGVNGKAEAAAVREGLVPAPDVRMLQQPHTCTPIPRL